MQDQKELRHYGVLGMKWGVRRAARKATKDIRAETRKANKESEKALGKYLNTNFNKKKAKERLDDAMAKVDKTTEANKKYKDAYKKAKADAVNKLYSKQSKATNDRVNSMSIGKALAQSMLMGSYGALKYNEARASGASRGKAAVKAVLSNTANNFTLNSMAARDNRRNRRARKSND